jgi:hypothetical protein
MQVNYNETSKTVFNNRAMTAHVSLKQRNWSNRERKEQKMEKLSPAALYPVPGCLQSGPCQAKTEAPNDAG